MLKYKYIFQIKYTEAVLSNSTRKVLWFEITKMMMRFKKIIVMYTVRQKKRNHFSFVNKSFNTQCNLTKFSTVVVKLSSMLLAKILEFTQKFLNLH